MSIAAVNGQLGGRSVRRRQRSKIWQRRHAKIQRQRRRKVEAFQRRLSRPGVSKSTPTVATTSRPIVPTTSREETAAHAAGGSSETERPSASTVQQVVSREQRWHASQVETVPSPFGSSATDGILLKIPVRVNGHTLISLVDSGATRCYLARKTVIPLGLHPVHEDALLELANGVKVHSDGCIPHMVMQMGKSIFHERMTVTELMPDVDIVLGMSWLEKINPLINWTTHTLYLPDQGQYVPVKGQSPDQGHKLGTVQHIALEDLPEGALHQLATIRTPQFWNVPKAALPWRKINDQTVPPQAQGPAGAKSAEPTTPMKTNQYIRQQKRTPQGSTTQRRTKASIKRQFVTLKQVRKEVKQGTLCHLVYVRWEAKQRRTTLHSIGTTEKAKRARSKIEGPVKQFKTVDEVKRDIVQQAEPSVRDALGDILADYPDVFPEKLPKGRPPHRQVEHVIETDPEAEPTSRAPYRLGPAEIEEMEEQLQDLLVQGFIRPSCSPYGAPILFIPKKDGRWRMCIDYRMLNKQTKKDKFPIPRIDELLDKLGRSKFFTKLDLASGYHQIAMSEADIQKTAFRTSRGQYEFIVMPFGLVNAPATFQRLMNSVFKNELGAFICVYLDDILVYSETLEDHIRHVRQALERLREAKLYGRLHKCEFFRTEVEYLGFDVGTQGIRASPDKVRAVREWPRPEGVRDVRSFLGLAAYYRRFIRHFSQIAAPLTNLTKDKIPFSWTETEDIAFRQLKQALTSAPVLHLPDFTKAFTITTDASLVSVGAVLEQDFGHGLQPVAYESKKLGPAEMRYSAYERELLGVVWALGKWRHYIEGRHCTIRSDHSSLRYLPNQPSVNRRIWKWVAILQGYDLDIVHIPGKINPADAMTRQVWVEDRKRSSQVQNVDEQLVDKLRVSTTAGDADIQKVITSVYKPGCTVGAHEAQGTSLEQAIDDIYDFAAPDQRVPVLAVSSVSSIALDPQFKADLTTLLRTEPPYDEIFVRLEDPSLPDFWDREEGKFMIRRGLLQVHHDQHEESDLPYWRIVVPRAGEFKERIMYELHAVPYAGHPGVARTIEHVRRQFWWRGMLNDIREFVLACPVCQVEKGSHQAPGGLLVPLPIPERKWDQVAIDFVTSLPEDEGMDSVLTVVDKATKMVHLIPCTKTITAKGTARAYWTHVGSLHGIPSVLISDRDDRFTSKFWRALWRILGTRLHMGTAYHPQSSGQVERFNQVLTQTLRCTIHQLGDTTRWVRHLPTIEYAMNCTPSRSTGYTPFYLNHGYHPVTPLQLLDQQTHSANETVDTFVTRLRSTFQTAQCNMKVAAEQMKAIADRRRRDVVFAQGSWVLLSTQNLRMRGYPSKLQRRFVGPFKVIERIGTAAYKLDLPSTWKIHPVFHAALLKPWRDQAYQPADAPAAAPLPDLEETRAVSHDDVYEVERLLRWRWRSDNHREKEYLVLWRGYPLEEASWVTRANFPDAAQFQAQVDYDQPVAS